MFFRFLKKNKFISLVNKKTKKGQIEKLQTENNSLKSLFNDFRDMLHQLNEEMDNLKIEITSLMVKMKRSEKSSN